VVPIVARSADGEVLAIDGASSREPLGRLDDLLKNGYVRVPGALSEPSAVVASSGYWF
jgi:hypothetical protein